MIISKESWTNTSEGTSEGTFTTKLWNIGRNIVTKLRKKRRKERRKRHCNQKDIKRNIGTSFWKEVGPIFGGTSERTFTMKLGKERRKERREDQYRKEVGPILQKERWGDYLGRNVGRKLDQILREGTSGRLTPERNVGDITIKLGRNVGRERLQ